jgi:cell division protein FtsA
VVVTGGTSILEGVPEVAEAVFSLPVRRGMPGEVGGLSDIVRSPIHSTAVGLALYGSRHAPRAANGTTDAGIAATVKRWLGGMF